MSLQPSILTHWTRIGLAVLGLLLIASATMRIYVYRYPSETSFTAAETEVPAVDLGDGVLLPRAVALHRSVPLTGCSTPASIDFVEAHPYGSDPSLVGAPGPTDRVFYVFHGWNLGSRFATTILNVIYFAHRAQARLMMRDSRAVDNLAVKVIVPANCNASLDGVMAALQRQIRSEL